MSAALEDPAPLTDTLTRLLAGRMAGGGHGAVLAGKVLTAHREVIARRARVLRHPDLARRLVTELGYARPEHWNGYVPPRLDPDDRREGTYVPPSAKLNTSPRRAALVAICTAALSRDGTAGE